MTMFAKVLIVLTIFIIALASAGEGRRILKSDETAVDHPEHFFGGFFPNPIFGGSFPKPALGGSTPTPAVGGATPTPTPAVGGPTPTPAKGGPTPIPGLGGSFPGPAFGFRHPGFCLLPGIKCLPLKSDNPSGTP